MKEKGIMDNINQQMQHGILYKEECYVIQGAIFEVYKTLGNGFLESVYQECLIREFSSRSIPFQNQPELPIFYKGEPVNLTFKPDFVCYDKIILELKTVHEIKDEHRAQLLNYLKITNLRLGLLVNFSHHPRVAIERVIL
jgi:GxxExxY protein